MLQELSAYVKDVKEGNAEPDFHMPLNSMSEVGRTLTSDGVQESISQQAAIHMPGFGSKRESPSKDGQPTESETVPLSRDGYRLKDTKPRKFGDALVEMEGARVTYGTKSVLGNWKQDVNGQTKRWSYGGLSKRGEKMGSVWT